ncbi:MAG: aminopeptidase P family protein [Candidatus Omnitrophica bacterium]|nr:aminopeptidase P family protein [Candidatus Omnitrophota bacterium]
MPKAAKVIIASSESDSNMLYATRFFVPDPFLFLEIDGRKKVVMSDLEVDRARSQARVDEVIAYSRVTDALRAAGVKHPGMTDVLAHLLREHGVDEVEVPGNFPVQYADKIREKGFRLQPKPEPFFAERAVKTEAEIEEITHTQRSTEEAVAEAVEVLRRSEIRGDHLYHEGTQLTAEGIRKLIHLELIKRDCLGAHTIVAPGLQGCDPHQTGTGPLLAHQSIILDVFPHSTKSHYYADMTRTVVRGRASDRLKKMYDAVLEGQEIGFSMIRDGADGGEIHRAILKRFEELGFQTGEKDGRMQGFFHGTGHGLGLDVHEPPRIGGVKDILRTGHVVTNEPGLYYPDAGAVRLEDLVVVTDTGCRNLTRFPKQLEL